MTNRKPNSDTGGRAQRRRAKREVQKAPQGTPAPEQQEQVLNQGPQITADDAFRKIGAMELELDWWKQEAEKKDRQITKLAEALAETGKPKAEKTSEEKSPE